MEIKISTRTDGRVAVTVFQMRGSLDELTHNILEKAVKEEYEKGMRYLILDLTDVTHLTSAGIRSIHEAFNLLRSGDTTEGNDQLKKGVREGIFKSHHLKLVNPSKRVQQVLALSGYDMFLEVHPDLEQAFRSF